MRKNSIQRLLLALLSMMLLPIMATATPANLSIDEDFTINAGETKEMLIDLENPNTTVTLVQFDLRLPDGLAIAEEDGEFVIDIAGRTTWRKHSLGANTINGFTRFLLSSQTNAVISGTNGAIISIMLVAGDSFNGGAIVLENQLIVTPDKEETKPADYTYIIPSPSVLVITADDKTREYGDDNPELTYQVEGAITGQPSLSTTATKTSPVGIYDIVVNRGSIEDNYTANNGHLTITKAPLTISAVNFSIQQGQAMPTFTATYSGFKNGETSAVLTTQPKFTTTATSTNVPGTYDIIVSGADAQNYDISFVKGTLTVSETSPTDDPYMVYALLDETPSYNLRRWEEDANAPVSLSNLTDFADRIINDSVSYGSASHPQKIKIEGLVWNLHPTYWETDNKRIKDFWENKKGYGSAMALAYNGYPSASTYQHNPAGWDYGYRLGSQNKTMGRDTICPMNKNWCHVWASPEEALLHPADIELYLSNRSSIRLSDYLGVHYYVEPNGSQTSASSTGVKTWKYNNEELRNLGLVWVFDTLDYYNGNTRSYDSRYITINHTDGTITAQNGIMEGYEPLVRIRLYHISNISDMSRWENIDATPDGIKYFNSLRAKPILDGYIRVHVTNTELIEITDYPAWNVAFDLLNDAQTPLTTWTQFNDLVLSDKFANMQKQQFNELYNIEEDGYFDWGNKIELVQYVKPRTTSSEDKYYTYKQLASAPYNWVPNKNNKDNYKIGHIYTLCDEDGTPNHSFFWAITTEEMDALTSNLTSGEAVTIQRYIHYTGHFYSSTDPNNADAKYDDIFIKMEVRLSRQAMKISVMSKKDVNYWYSIDGQMPAINPPLAAIACNTPMPQDGLSTIPWQNTLTRCFDGNIINLTNSTGSGKFYFVPYEYELRAKDGTVYVVTPRRGSDDNIYDKFIDLYDNNIHNYCLSTNGCGDETANNSILNQYSISYQPDIASIAKAYNIYVSSIVNPSAWPKCDGAFSNDTLYAIRKTDYNIAREYEPIAIITNTSTSSGGGRVVLLREYVENKWLNYDAQPSGNKYTFINRSDKENEYTESCLNAVGYDSEVDRDLSGKMTGTFNDKCNPLNKQLRAYIGVITGNNDNLAQAMTDESNLFATFQSTWVRPINMVVDPAYLEVNSSENTSTLYALDVIKLFDWRGASSDISHGGYMWDKQTWLWAYYGVKSIQIDTRKSSVRVNVNGRTSTLSSIPNIYVSSLGGSTLTTFPVNLSSYNNQASNEALRTYMESNKRAFGYISIENGPNCPRIYILYIPIQIEYEWGVISDTLTIYVISGDGIGSLNNEQQTKDTEVIYNLSGQRLSAPQRGVNIINGKKVVIK